MQSAFQEDMGLCLAAFFLLFSILSFVVAVGYTAMCGVYTATLSAVCLASFDLPCLRSSGFVCLLISVVTVVLMITQCDTAD